jgi:hypothetical protein
MADVAAFVRDYRRLPLWLTFITDVREEDGKWYMETADGAMQIEFMESNSPGTLDHRVTVANGRQFHNRMRVHPVGAESEVEFTLEQVSGMSDEQFAADAATVERDLANLRRLLEQTPDE